MSVAGDFAGAGAGAAGRDCGAAREVDRRGDGKGASVPGGVSVRPCVSFFSSSHKRVVEFAFVSGSILIAASCETKSSDIIISTSPGR